MKKNILNKLYKALNCLRYPKFLRAYFYFVCPLFELKSAIKKVGLIENLIDIGSNKGQFCLIARILNPNCKIFSFEPQKEFLKIQKKIIKKNIYFYSFCLGEKKQYKNLFITKRSDSSSLLEPHILKNDIYSVKQKIKVKIEKLDNILKKKKLQNTLMKIDVQGYEYQVLKGASKILDKINYIIIELSSNKIYKKQILKKKILKFLSKKNFFVIKIYNKSYVKKNIYQYDYLLKRKV